MFSLANPRQKIIIYFESTSQRFCCYLIDRPKNEVSILFLALEEESLLVHITSSKKLPAMLSQLLSDSSGQMNMKIVENFDHSYNLFPLWSTILSICILFTCNHFSPRTIILSACCLSDFLVLYQVSKQSIHI